MKRLLTMLLSGLLATVLATGCGGEGAKGVNKEKDKPRAADKDAG